MSSLVPKNYFEISPDVIDPRPSMKPGWHDLTRYTPAIGDVFVRYGDGHIDVAPAWLLSRYGELYDEVVAFRPLPAALDDRWIPFHEGKPGEGEECLVLWVDEIRPDRWCNGAFQHTGNFSPVPRAWMSIAEALGEVAP